MSIISPTDTHIVMALQAESKVELQNTLQNMDFFVHYSGVGMLAAAQKTTEVILKHQPKNILNLGTAGSFLLEPGQLVQVERVVHRGASFAGMNKDILLAKMQPVNLPLVKEAGIVCGSADFIETPSNREELTKRFSIMDMEAYAIATVCEKYKIPFYCFKYISDRSGADVVQEWKSHLQSASQQFSQLLHELIK